jgi:hypothetical protein
VTITEHQENSYFVWWCGWVAITEHSLSPPVFSSRQALSFLFFVNNRSHNKNVTKSKTSQAKPSLAKLGQASQAKPSQAKAKPSLAKPKPTKANQAKPSPA